jgi:hypothetical protein
MAGKVTKVVVGAVIASLCLAAGLWLKREIAIDSCLDLGGRWNYQADVCETEKSN